MTAPTITRTANGSVVLKFPFHKFLVESLKIDVPAHARTYDPDTRAWTVTEPYAPIAFRLMHVIFPDVVIVDAAAADRAPRAGDAYRVLHLLPSAPPELVTAAHRCLAKLNHPDRGGSTVAMQQINAAVDLIREAS